MVFPMTLSRRIVAEGSRRFRNRLSSCGGVGSGGIMGEKLAGDYSLSPAYTLASFRERKMLCFHISVAVNDD
jgi:hypothetical protein